MDTGLDLSPTHLATGRAKASDVGVQIELRQGDLTAVHGSVIRI